MKQNYTKVIGMSIILFVVLVMSATYGCCKNIIEPFESISTESPTPELMKKIEDTVISKLAREDTKDSVKTVHTVNTVLQKLAMEKKPAVMEPLSVKSAKKPEPVIKKDEPAIKKPEPVMKKDEPAIKKPEPVVKKDEPAIKKPEPVAKKVEELPKKESLEKKDDSTKSIVDKLLEDKKKETEKGKGLNKQEQELFEQITKNTIPADDLDKLIRAGALTENMVEKFLNEIDRMNQEKIEGFCSGPDCYATV